MLVMPSSAVRAKRSSSRAAPSSMEYSVCTWRWTKSPALTDPDDMGGAALLSGAAVRCQTVGQAGGRPGRTSWGKDASLRDHEPHRSTAHRQPPSYGGDIDQ